jgi:hypothetical protein
MSPPIYPIRATHASWHSIPNDAKPMQGAQVLTLVVNSKPGGIDWKAFCFVLFTDHLDTLFCAWDYHDGIK